MVCAPDDRLGEGEDVGAEDDGGIQQQRHPALDEQAVKSEPAKQFALPDLERDDHDAAADKRVKLGRASCGERVCQSVLVWVGEVSLSKKSKTIKHKVTKRQIIK